MNHETTIQKIQSLVPDVMKLEFGCEVKSKHTFHKVRNAKMLAYAGWGSIQVQERIDTSENKEEYEKDYGHSDITYYEPDTFKILGKPITLAVVIKSVIKSQPKRFGASTVDNQIKMTEPLNRTFLRLIERWNLSQDNFNDQSDETKEFIGELLN